MTKLPNKTKLIPHAFCKFYRQLFATESYLLIINSPTAEETLPDIRWVHVDHLSFVNFFCRFDTFFISPDSHLNLMLTRAVLVSLPEWAVQWSFMIFKPVLLPTNSWTIYVAVGPDRNSLAGAVDKFLKLTCNTNSKFSHTLKGLLGSWEAKIILSDRHK